METWELQPKNAAIRARLLLTKVPNWERVDKKEALVQKKLFQGLCWFSSIVGSHDRQENV